MIIRYRIFLANVSGEDWATNFPNFKKAIVTVGRAGIAIIYKAVKK